MCTKSTSNELMLEIYKRTDIAAISFAENNYIVTTQDVLSQTKKYIHFNVYI